MRGTQQIFNHGPCQTQPCPTTGVYPPAASVGLLKVMFVGAPRQTEGVATASRPALDTTLRDARPQPSSPCCAVPPERLPSFDAGSSDWRATRWRNFVADTSADARLAATRHSSGGADASALRALSFAPTLPALPALPALPRVPGLPERQTRHEPEPLQLRTDITRRDRRALEAPPRSRRQQGAARETPRAVVAPSDSGPLARAWALWLQQPPHVAIGAAAMLCLLSALAARLLM